jgi:hypothetical protein
VSRLRPIRRPRDIPALLHLTEPRRGFGPVLAMIVVAVIFQLAAPDADWARLATIGIQGAVVMMAMRAAGAHPRLFRIGSGGVLLLIAAAIVAELFRDWGPGFARVISLALILITPLAVTGGVVRELEEDKRVTVQTVFCGLCLYLLIGMAFAFLYAFLNDVGSHEFFRQNVPESPNDFLYFSLVTLTTTGYGDFTAATELGRTFAVTEALLGQIYLVTVLAVIVSNVRRRRAAEG